MNKVVLTDSLNKAATTLIAEDLSYFFQTLLDSKVYIAGKAETKNSMDIPLVGNLTNNDFNYLFIEIEGQNLLPIFSEESFLQNWAEREITILEEKFSKLLWQLPPNSWFYLNPGQDIGKEFSPYEIELLKQGQDAFPELIQLALETENDDFEITNPTPELQKLENPLIPVLEIYPELEEAFLLSLKESDSVSPRGLIGIRYSTGMEKEKSDYIRSEIERTALEFLTAPYTGVFIVDDLSNPESPNQTLFLDAQPFYKKNP